MAILDLDQAMNSNSTTASPCHAAHASPASDQRLRQAECKSGDAAAADPNPRHQAEDAEEQREDDDELLLKGVRHLCERGGGITRLPARYVLPPSDRPDHHHSMSGLTIPVIDLARLRAPGAAGRAAALAELDAACRDYGFFQVVGHGMGGGGGAMLDVARRFFELPFGERARHMSPDIRAPVRYGTSFNQLNDGVLCWRDFLKLVCDDLDAVVPAWPDAPADLRKALYVPMKCQAYFCKVVVGSRLQPPHNLIEDIVVLILDVDMKVLFLICGFCELKNGCINKEDRHACCAVSLGVVPGGAALAKFTRADAFPSLQRVLWMHQSSLTITTTIARLWKQQCTVHYAGQHGVPIRCLRSIGFTFELGPVDENYGPVTSVSWAPDGKRTRTLYMWYH